MTYCQKGSYLSCRGLASVSDQQVEARTANSLLHNLFLSKRFSLEYVLAAGLFTTTVRHTRDADRLC